MVLIDTNIVIEWLKGNEDIIRNLELIGYNELGISSITKMEVLIGARNASELKVLEKAINSLDVYHLNARISKEGVLLIKKFKLSHNLQIPDALIAATSMIYQVELFTLNKKDFHFIQDIKLWNT